MRSQRGGRTGGQITKCIRSSKKKFTFLEFYYTRISISLPGYLTGIRLNPSMLQTSRSLQNPSFASNKRDSSRMSTQNGNEAKFGTISRATAILGQNLVF
jgi:hypothetical protein